MSQAGEGRDDAALIRQVQLRATQLANEGGAATLSDIATLLGTYLEADWSALLALDLGNRPSMVWSEGPVPAWDPALPPDASLELQSALELARTVQLERGSDPDWLIIPIASTRRTENVFVFGAPGPAPEDATLELLDAVRFEVEQLLERRRVTEELTRSNAELARFASVASHDLQEPLRKITGFLGLLENRYADELDDTAREYIDFAVGGATRLQHLISDLLAYARIGQSDRVPTDVDLAVLVADVARDAGLDAEHLEIGPLPTITGYRPELRQLFDNVLGNAAKFAAKDGPHVTVTSQRQPGSWAIEVTDRGIGIPADQVARVFDAFFRGHPSRRYEGTGIGLAICRKVAEHHGGSIAASSIVGSGTTITIELPGA